jgi:hypothetical protein
MRLRSHGLSRSEIEQQHSKMLQRSASFPPTPLPIGFRRPRMIEKTACCQRRWPHSQLLVAFIRKDPR